MSELISVVIPVYNTVDYIDECICGVIAQTYNDLEIIIIDDGSTDGSGALCDAYANKDPRIIVIHQKNKGAVSARKAGIFRASGKYICFVDSDDRVETDYVKDMADHIEDADMVTAGAYKEVAGEWMIRQDAFHEGLYASDDKMGYLLKNMMKYRLASDIDGILPYIYAKLFRTRIAKETADEVAEDLAYTDDSDFLYHYILKCKSVYITHNKNYRYRERMGSICNGENSHVLSDLNTLYLSLRPVFEKHPLRDELMSQLQLFIRARVEYALSKMGIANGTGTVIRYQDRYAVGTHVPTISVLVPVYNVQPYLRECLDSLIRQTYTDIEIICIDDGSTDGSENVLDEYAANDERIRVIHKKNSGYGHTMNVGLDEARGEYIGILESDDTVTPDMFEKLLCAARNTDAEVVRGNFAEIKESGINLTRFGEWARLESPFTAREIPELLYDRLAIWSGLYRRDFLEHNNIRFNETPGASFQDTSFFFFVWLYAEKMTLIPDITVNYRMINGTSSINSPAKLFCICDEFKHIEDRLKAENAALEIWHVEQVMKYMKYEWNFRRVSEQYQYGFLMEMVKQFEAASVAGLLNRHYWPQWLWNDMNRMVSETEAWFADKSKQVIPLDAEYGNRGYLGLCRKGLIERLKMGDCYFYGTGKVAERLYSKFDVAGVGSFAGAIVTKKNGQDFFHDLPIYGVDDERISKDVPIIVAVGKRLLPEIYGELMKRGFKNIIVPDSLFWMIWDYKGE